MHYILLKSINPDTTIGVSNLKYEIEISNLAKFCNNAETLLDDIYLNYSINIDKKNAARIMFATSLGLYCQGQTQP